MRKLILSFALLFAITTIAQPGRFSTLKITGNSEDNSATKVLVQSSDNSVNWKAFSEFANTLQGVLDNSPNPAIGYGRTVRLKNDSSSDSSIEFNLDDFFESYIRVQNGGIGSGGYYTQIGSHVITFDGNGDYLQTLTTGPCQFCDYQLPGESGIIATRNWVENNIPPYNYQSVLDAGQTSTTDAIHVSGGGGITARTKYSGAQIEITVDEDPSSILQVKPWFTGSLLDVHWPDASGTILTREQADGLYQASGGTTTVNLSYTASPTNGSLETDTGGSSASIPAANATNAGLLLPSDYTKLSNLSGVNSGNVTKTGENYLTLSGQALTANAVNLGNSNTTGTLTIGKGGTGMAGIGTALQFLRVNAAGTALEYASSSAMNALTTTGTSGAATFSTNTLNVPRYDTYADSKVQNSLAASTTVAPSATAVNTADANLQTQIDGKLSLLGVTESYSVLPIFGSTNTTAIGATAFVFSNGPTQRSYDPSSSYGRKTKVALLTGATAGTTSASRQNPGFLSLSDKFDYIFTVGFNEGATTTGMRAYAGLYQPNSVPPNSDPSAFVNVVGVCRLTASGNLYVIYNDASGTATTIDTGFPANTSATDYYRVKISNDPATGATFTVTRANTGAIFTTSTNTDLPSSTFVMATSYSANNGANAVSFAMDFFGHNITFTNR